MIHCIHNTLPFRLHQTQVSIHSMESTLWAFNRNTTTVSFAIIAMQPHRTYRIPDHGDPIRLNSIIVTLPCSQQGPFKLVNSSLGPANLFLPVGEHIAITCYGLLITTSPFSWRLVREAVDTGSGNTHTPIHAHHNLEDGVYGFKRAHTHTHTHRAHDCRVYHTC